MTKITNAIALSIAIANLSDMPSLYDAQGVNQISDEEKDAVIERLTKMFDTTVKRAAAASSRERKPSAKEVAAKEENAKLAESVYATMLQKPNFLFECKGLADDCGVSTPKMARILGVLVEDGKVERIEGKKPHFKVKGE